MVTLKTYKKIIIKFHPRTTYEIKNNYLKQIKVCGLSYVILSDDVSLDRAILDIKVVGYSSSLLFYIKKNNARLDVVSLNVSGSREFKWHWNLKKENQKKLFQSVGIKVVEF